MAKNIRPGSVLVLDRKWGSFTYILDEHRQINCNMNFGHYPMDNQVCYFRILSAIYDQDKLVSFPIFMRVLEKSSSV